VSERWRPEVVLVDGRNLLFRCTDAHRDLSIETEDGSTLLTGGVFGMLNVMVKLKKRYGCGFLVAWEGTDNFRFKIWPTYKQRPPASQDVIRFQSNLQNQEDMVREILSCLGVRQYEAVGGEADDVLGTLATMAREKDLSVGIFTGDSDLHQMVDDSIRVIQPQPGSREKVWDVAAVIERWGVGPDKVALLKAFAGDSSDNIPGVRGVGPKTAALMVRDLGTMEAIIAAATDGPKEAWLYGPSTKAKVAATVADLPTFLDLTTIRCDMKMKPHPVERDVMKARRLMASLKFRKLLEHAHFIELKRLGL
jgi:5'-3' exonuclease